jgi:hypothetical protein
LKSNYEGKTANVNDDYLRQCFYWAQRLGCSLPVYQINFGEKTENIKADKFVLMIAGNENHVSTDYYYEDSRICAIIQNYPAMTNHGGEIGQSYEYTMVDGVPRFVVLESDPRTLVIPLGYTNGFYPYNITKRKALSGFFGQWTQNREEYAKHFNNHYREQLLFGFYNGFGPFVTDNEDGSLDIQAYAYNIANLKVAMCFSGQSPETYRLCEAAASGCAIISTILPDVWYYDKIPALFIDLDMNFLEATEHLLKNQDTIDQYQMMTSAWYNSFATPKAVGIKIAAHVGSVL